MESKNALAELAERLSPRGETKTLFLVNAKDILKAQRIVAEVAKVDELRNKSNKTDADLAIYNTMLAMLPINCRAIAEEEIAQLKALEGANRE